ncbi:MAG: RNA polymerase sigma factor [Hyphomonadaceae bacterium]
MPGQPKVVIDHAALDEAALVKLARSGDGDAFRAIMKRGNQRLFRVARAVVREDAEAEDVVQDAYLRAFANLDAFRGDASIFTWLTRITINEANGRLRKRRPTVGLDQIEATQAKGGDVIMFPNGDPARTPEADAARAQIRRALEAAIDDLPEAFRVVFVLRDVEDCSIAETAAALDVLPETVKTRLHRARRLLREALSERLASSMTEAFPFLGRRCDRITESVIERLISAQTLREET